MAILDSEKIDFLWKKVVYGVTKTAGALTKAASNESIASPLVVLPSQIWADGGSLPVPAPSASTSLVSVCKGSSRIALTSDPTSPPNVSWLACSTVGQPSARMSNFIPPTLDVSYLVQVYVGDPNVGPAARIFPDTTGQEFVFDYTAGVLVFEGAIPAELPASIGSGVVSVSTDGVYIQAYQYVGSFGLGAGQVSGLGTMAQENSDSIAVTGGTISNVTLTNCTIDAGEF